MRKLESQPQTRDVTRRERGNRGADSDEERGKSEKSNSMVRYIERRANDYT